MRILIIGLFSFLGWSTFSTYVYVCKIKGLCDVPVSIKMSDLNSENTLVSDTVQKNIIQKPLSAPKNLIIYFDFDKSEFSSSNISSKYFEESQAYLNQNKQASIEITGHTDAIGTNIYNDALGYRRAQNVEQYLESKGVPKNSIELISFGENKPVDNNKTVEGRANNRRAEIKIK